MQLLLLAAVAVRLWNTEPQQMPELATVARSTADIRELTVSAEERSITFAGTAQQNAIAEWLVRQLDFAGPRPAGVPYKVGPDDVVRVFYLQSPESAQQVQEIVTTARSVAEVPRAFVYQGKKAMVARGTAEQIALLEWLVPQLDVARPRSGSPQFRVGGRLDDVARVFYVHHAGSMAEFQEMATVVRSIGEIRQMFAYGAAKAIAMRGTPDQAAVAEFLVGRLDQPAGKFAAGPEEHLMSETPENVVRLFAFSGVSLPELQRRAVEVRGKAEIRRAFLYTPHRALVVRGTSGQVAEAARLAASQP